MEKPLTIVGLDPGTTTAYALLDLKGNLLGSFSSKELSLSQVISLIIGVSQPLVSCSDKSKTPSFVHDFSSSLGTILLSPAHDLQKQEKKELVRPYVKLANSHELDSLAAAAYIYRKIRPTLEKIDLFIRENKLEGMRNKFTLLVFKDNLNFHAAKEILTLSSEEDNSFQKIIEKPQISKSDFLKLLGKYAELKKDNRLLVRRSKQIKEGCLQLKKSNSFLSKKLSQSDLKVDRLLKFKEDRIKSLSQQLNTEKDILNSLRREINSIYSFISKVPRHQLLKRVDNLGQDEFSRKSRLLDLGEQDFLWVNNPQIYSEKVLAQLQQQQVRLVSEKKFNERIKREFVTFNIKELADRLAHFVLVRPEQLEKQMNSEDLIKIVDSYKKKREDGKKT